MDPSACLESSSERRWPVVMWCPSVARLLTTNLSAGLVTAEVEGSGAASPALDRLGGGAFLGPGPTAGLAGFLAFPPSRGVSQERPRRLPSRPRIEVLAEGVRPWGLAGGEGGRVRTLISLVKMLILGEIIF